MSRATVEEVRQILDTDITDNEIQAFIESANRIVTSVLGSDTTLSDYQKADIEKWLACHLITMTKDRWAVREKLGDAAVEYPPLTGEGLKATPYGQMVLALDVTGKMGRLGKAEAKIIAVDSFE